MFGVRHITRVVLFACALVASESATGAAHAAPQTSGPAYGVEPGEAPKNSVAVGAQGAAPAAPSSGKAPKSAQGAAAPAAPAAPAPSNAAAPVPQEAPPDANAQSAGAAAPEGESGTVTSTEVSDNDPRALTDFRPQLDPYGTWVEDPKYGVVWVPNRSVVGDGFSPYVTAGHWALDTDGNWIWVSDYPFGEVVFHYGRWVWTASYGWSWIPGYRYAPAWVVWRVPTAEYAYVGWAPAPPAFVWWGGIGMSIWWGPPYYWVFCPSRFVFAHYTSYYVVRDRAFVRTLGGATRRYIAASPRVTSPGPSMQSARIPSGALPETRVPSSHGIVRPPTTATAPSRDVRVSRPTFGSSGTREAPTGQSRNFYEGRPNAAARAVPNAPVSRAGPTIRQEPRAVSAPPRAAAPPASTYAAPARTYTGVAPRYTPYTPPPRVYSPSAPAYSPPARAYSPARVYTPSPRVYSPPARVYSPSPRVYSSPSVSAPAYHAPAYRPSYSTPHAPSPHSFGGGGRHR